MNKKLNEMIIELKRNQYNYDKVNQLFIIIKQKCINIFNFIKSQSIILFFLQILS